MEYQLVERSGPTAGSVHPLDRNEIFIGRDLNNDVVINHREVSRRHLRLIKQGMNYVLEDLQSTNGTYIGGQKIITPHILYPGEVITLGESITLYFEAIEPSPGLSAYPPGPQEVDATAQAPMRAYEPPQPQPRPVEPPRPEPQPIYQEPAHGQGYVDPYAPLPPAQDQPYDSYIDSEDNYFMDAAAQPQAGYRGSEQPVMPSERGYPGEKKRIPNLYFILGGVLFVLLCLCVVGGYIIDSQNMYCNQLGFLFDDLLGLCP